MDKGERLGKAHPMAKDFTIVTEVPGVGATKEQLARLHQRYSFGSRYCQGKRVLEVACGAGVGLGYLGRTASLVVGGDYTDSLIRTAQNHYRGVLPLLRLDAHSLPFKDASFDTVVLFEALYYLHNPDKFLQEGHRILSEKGTLVLCTVNKDWSDFNPSPLSTAYYSAPELFSLLTRNGFQAELFGGFPVVAGSASQKAVSLVRRTAVSLHLIPKSMKGKEWLKRIFYGKLAPLPAELSWEGDKQTLPAPITSEVPTDQYKILYAVGYRQ